MRISNSPREILGLSNCRPLLNLSRNLVANCTCTPEGEGRRGGEERGVRGGEGE